MNPLRIRAAKVPCVSLSILPSADRLFALCRGIAFQEIQFLFLALPVPAVGLWWFLQTAGVSLKTQH